MLNLFSFFFFFCFFKGNKTFNQNLGILGSQRPNQQGRWANSSKTSGQSKIVLQCQIRWSLCPLFAITMLTFSFIPPFNPSNFLSHKTISIIFPNLTSPEFSSTLLLKQHSPMSPLKEKEKGGKRDKKKVTKTNLLIEKINVERKVAELNCAIGKLHV